MRRSPQGQRAKESRKALCSFQGVRKSQPHRVSGDNSLRDPPVPIPNTEVKPHIKKVLYKKNSFVII